MQKCRNAETQTHKGGRRPCENNSRDWSDESTNHQKLGNGRDRLFPTDFRNSMALRYLDFGLLASRTVRQYTWVLLSHSLCGILLWQSSPTDTCIYSLSCHFLWPSFFCVDPYGNLVSFSLDLRIFFNISHSFGLLVMTNFSFWISEKPSYFAFIFVRYFARDRILWWQILAFSALRCCSLLTCIVSDKNSAAFLSLFICT